MMGGRYDFSTSNNEDLRLSAAIYSSGVLRDLTGYEGSMQVRISEGATGTVLDATGCISIATGTVSVVYPAASMADVDPGDYVYDLIIGSTATTERILHGTISVIQGVTR